MLNQIKNGVKLVTSGVSRVLKVYRIYADLANIKALHLTHYLDLDHVG